MTRHAGAERNKNAPAKSLGTKKKGPVVERDEAAGAYGRLHRGLCEALCLPDRGNGSGRGENVSLWEWFPLSGKMAPKATKGPLVSRFC